MNGTSNNAVDHADTRRNSERKLIVVTRHTRLNELLYRHNTVEQARFYVESLGSDFDDYLLEDQLYKAALKQVEQQLGQVGRVQLLERNFLPNFVFGPDEVIIVIGQDGLVANTLKYIPDRPVIAVNPDPARFDGVLLPFQVEDITNIVEDLLFERRDMKEITMASAELSDGQRLLAVNDLFIGPVRHTSARYELVLDGETEFQSSSGVIVSTGLGSTGWFKSILTGAMGVSRSLGNDVEETGLLNGFAWDSKHLFYSVREPFPSHTTGTDLIFGEIDRSSEFSITSAMPQDGVIFSDGLLDDALNFNSGITADIGVAREKGLLVV